MRKNAFSGRWLSSAESVMRRSSVSQTVCRRDFGARRFRRRECRARGQRRSCPACAASARRARPAETAQRFIQQVIQPIFRDRLDQKIQRGDGISVQRAGDQIGTEDDDHALVPLADAVRCVLPLRPGMSISRRSRSTPGAIGAPQAPVRLQTRAVRMPRRARRRPAAKARPDVPAEALRPSASQICMCTASPSV